MKGMTAMSLPATDLKYLEERAINYSVATEANMTCVILAAYGLPSGLNQTHSDLLLRLSPGYPDIPPDMWWFNPPVLRSDGRTIPATDVIEHHLGRTWQRWSRHFNSGQWRPGIDCLETFLALVRNELKRSALEKVA